MSSIKKLIQKKSRFISRANLKEAMECCVLLANKYEELGEFEKCILEWKERLELSEQTKNDKEVAKCHRYVAN
jgi:hypothetical protein